MSRAPSLHAHTSSDSSGWEKFGMNAYRAAFSEQVPGQFTKQN